MVALSLSLRCGVLTVSDTRTPDTDASGAYLAQALQAQGHAVQRALVPDEEEAIAGQLLRWQAGQLDLVLTKPLPGFGELFRMLSYGEIGGAAMLSRAAGGLAGRMLLFALPGSLGAVKTGWGLLAPQLPHLISEVRRQEQP